MSQQNVQSARELYDAFNRGDLETFERGLSQQIMWNEAENSLNCAGNPYRSYAAVLDGVFKPTLRDFDQFRVDLEQLIDAGEYAIGCGHYRGRSKATGKQASVQFCHVLHFDQSGRLDRLQEYADTLQEAEVTGQVQRLEPMEMPQPVI
jgi:ketosteroid isomerase-like protein